MRYLRRAWLGNSKIASRECFFIKKIKQSYAVLGGQANIAVAASAKVEKTCRNRTIDPETSRDDRRKWIQKRGKHKPSSPKPRKTTKDILQWMSIEAKCTIRNAKVWHPQYACTVVVNATLVASHCQYYAWSFPFIQPLMPSTSLESRNYHFLSLLQPEWAWASAQGGTRAFPSGNFGTRTQSF